MAEKPPLVDRIMAQIRDEEPVCTSCKERCSVHTYKKGLCPECFDRIYGEDDTVCWGE
jgi:hypothetical protein